MPIKSSSVIEVNDTKWSDIVSSSYVYDFYHTQSYHQLEINNRPVLFVANFEKDFIAIPLIIISYIILSLMLNSLSKK